MSLIKDYRSDEETFATPEMKQAMANAEVGGGMAQAGHIAAPGVVALQTMIDRIEEDLINARRLSIGLANLNENMVDVKNTLTNIVQVNFKSTGKDAYYMYHTLQNYDIKVKVIDSTTCRLVTHRGITSQDIDETIDIIKNILH